jgi:hypothetical protein
MQFALLSQCWIDLSDQAAKAMRIKLAMLRAKPRDIDSNRQVQ